MLSKYGIKIRELREKKNDTLEDLAKKLNIGWSALGKLERGERRITPDILEEVANVYNVPLSYFFGKEVPVSDELKKYGVEWVTMVDELVEEGLTPEETKALIEIAQNLLKLQKENN